MNEFYNFQIMLNSLVGEKTCMLMGNLYEYVIVVMPLNNDFGVGGVTPSVSYNIDTKSIHCIRGAPSISIPNQPLYWASRHANIVPRCYQY